MADVSDGLTPVHQIVRPRHERRKSKVERSSTKNGHFYRNRKAPLPSNQVLHLTTSLVLTTRQL